MKSLAIVLLICELASAQTGREHKSIHWLQNDLHRSERTVDTPYPTASVPLNVRRHVLDTLSKKVFGWHPYWAASTAYLSYDYSVLTHIGFFSYETDTATGSYTTLHGWTTTPLIDTAHVHGVKVALTVTNFGYDENDKILSDTTKQSRMIDTLIRLLQARNGDGIDFDFEQVRGAQKSNLVVFMQHVAQRVKAVLPSAEISMAAPAVDWDSAFDFLQLSQACDYLIMMGYDYYWPGSATAGPVAPLTGEAYDVTASIDTYLAAGVNPARLFLGVPWYGYDWPTSGNRRKAPSTASANSYLYPTLESEAETDGKIFDTTDGVPWFSYQSGPQWHQAWYDDSLSLAMKYEFANSKHLGGIGIWALSYQGSAPILWNCIHDALLDTLVSAVRKKNNAAPASFSLSQNYPNPFNPTTNFQFSISFAAGGLQFVSLKVYDVLGREVATLVNEVRQPGVYISTWDAAGCASGVYYCRFVAGRYTESRKMLLIR